MRTEALDFELPERLIATSPAEPRDAARLMVIDRAAGTLEHRRVRDLPALVEGGGADKAHFRAGDLMIVNRSRVLPAYWEGRRAATGGRVTGLYLNGNDEDGGRARWSVMLETRGKPGVGEVLELEAEAQAGLRLVLRERTGPGTWIAEPRGLDDTALNPEDALAALRRVGKPPLPPYIRKARKAMGLTEFTESDRERYETVYATGDDASGGSIAAPTAGLHFTPALLDRLDALGLCRVGVTLHVGVGTFLPVRSETLEGHAMHSERFAVSPDALDALRVSHTEGRRRLVVGTTAVRTLESLPHPLPTADARPDGIAGDTDLFIRPDVGFTFRHTDALLTNFHLPQSTLIALVASLPGVGLANLKAWYAEAIAHEYRFFSYGDAMLLV
ncbi:MAG: S-adenosylmethionine:tRNA ribosyltransferase-isomerase [Planctomycetota bacterium]